MRLLATLALAFCAAVAAAEAPAPAPQPAAAVSAAAPTMQQPRPFGYVLGDILIQRVLLRTNDRNFTPESLPPSERAGLWFARRSSHIQTTDDGRRWLVMDYQLVNAPQTLMTVNLPSVTLKAKSGNTEDVLVVPEWPVSVGPLTPRAAFAKGDLQELRPDHPAPTLPTASLRRQVAIWAIATAVTIAIWIGWWLVRQMRAAANQPFARALREIRRTGDDSTGALLAVHRAFDRTAGRAVHLSTLPILFKRAPHFEPERSAIEQFYADSNRRFFEVTPAANDAQPYAATTGDAQPGAGPGATPTNVLGTGAGVATTTRTVAATAAPVRPSHVPVSPRALCTALRKIEKQHER